MRRIGRDRAERWIRTASLPVINCVALIVVLLMAFADPLVVSSKQTPLQIYGAFSSRADVQAMQWIEHNTRLDSLILNHPGPQEGDWAPIVAQRNTVYFRMQPFFRDTDKVEAMQEALLAFWRNPADPANADLLARYDVSYVLVPQIVNRPGALKTMFRWRPPLPGAASYQTVRDVSYLKLVFDADGAQVYQVTPVRAAR
jgi:hypothetical protein